MLFRMFSMSEICVLTLEVYRYRWIEEYIETYLLRYCVLNIHKRKIPKIAKRLGLGLVYVRWLRDECTELKTQIQPHSYFRNNRWIYIFMHKKVVNMVLLTLVFVFFVIVQIVYGIFFLHSCTFKLLGKKTLL